MPDTPIQKPEKVPQISKKVRITLPEAGASPAEAEMADRRTRKPKRKQYKTKEGVRTFFEGYAFANLSPTGRWVTANDESESGARYKAIARAADLEAEAAAEEGRRREQAFQDALDAARSAGKPKDSSMTVDELFKEYVQFCSECEREDSTIDKYERDAKKFSSLVVRESLPPLGDLRLDQLQGEGMRKGFQIAHDRMLRFASPNTVHNRWGFLRSVLTFAINENLLTGNPIANVKIVAREQKGDLEVPDDQLALLMREVRDDAPALAGLMLSIGCGSRAQETVGVTDEDIEGDTLVFKRQLKRVRQDGPHGPGDIPPPDETPYGPKGDGSILALGKLKSTKVKVEYEIAPEMRILFKEALLSAKPVVIWDAVERRWKTVRFVVHAPRGGALEAQHFRARFVKLCSQKRLSAKLHDLRAVFASNLAMREKNIKVVSRLLRHCDIATTELYLRGLKGETRNASRGATEEAARLAGLIQREHQGEARASRR